MTPTVNAMHATIKLKLQTSTFQMNLQIYITRTLPKISFLLFLFKWVMKLFNNDTVVNRFLIS